MDNTPTSTTSAAHTSIPGRLASIKDAMPAGVELVAVSKFHPVEALREAYGAGQRIFGESRALELRDKAGEMPSDVEWHFIGHLQSNKVRTVLPHVTLIHSIDSERLLRLVDTEARRLGRRVGVLLQVHVAREETKYGFSPEELLSIITPQLVESLPGVEIRGVMGMASNVDDSDRIAADFDALRHAFDSLRAGVFASAPSFSILSMGMSHDWPIAVAHGSNMIRVGTDIFGEREY